MNTSQVIKYIEYNINNLIFHTQQDAVYKVYKNCHI
jgi:hypothetical protein